MASALIVLGNWIGITRNAQSWCDDHQTRGRGICAFMSDVPSERLIVTVAVSNRAAGTMSAAMV
jgi:hypothetical protein